MKTFLIVLFTIGLTNLTYSQESLEKSNLEELATANNIIKSINSDYLKNVNSNDTPIKVMKLQNIAAKYKIKDAEIYKSKSNSTYDVVFEEANCKIVATYNNKGEIINSVETFKNIRLPQKLSTEISKEYPNWRFTGNVHTINYNKTNGSKKAYTVEIKNGNYSKMLKFNLLDKPEMSFVAVN